jgi:RHS repeat-associated protein
VKELSSLVETHCYFPFVNATIFPNTPTSYFWSASTVSYYSIAAWGVDFGIGNASYDPKTNEHQVRLVRAGQDYAANDKLHPPALSLTVSSTNGTVTSAPAGINCGTICQADFPHATVVTLTAIPNTGSYFSGWSGTCTGSGPCTVTMDAAKSVTANYASPVPYCTNVPSALSTNMGYLSNRVVGGKFVLLGIECTARPADSSPPNANNRYFKRFELLRQVGLNAPELAATAPANAYTVSYSNLLWSSYPAGTPILNWSDLIQSVYYRYFLQAVMSDGAVLTASPAAASYFDIRTGSNLTAQITPTEDLSFTTASASVRRDFTASTTGGGNTDWYISSSRSDAPDQNMAGAAFLFGAGNQSNTISTRGWGLETVVLESSLPRPTSDLNVTYDKRSVIFDRAFDVGDPAQSGSGSALVNDVDVATGNLHFTVPDLSVPAIGVPLSYTRAYNSMARLGNCTGVWRSNATISLFYLDRSGGRQIGVRREDGREQDFFRYDVDGLWHSFNPGSFDQLVQLDDTTFRLFTKGSTFYEFQDPPVDHDNAAICDNSYNIVSRSTGSNATLISDRNGNNVQTVFNVDRKPVTITHSNGRTLTLQYDPATGQVSQVTDNFGRSVSYTYDTDGYLIGVTDAAGRVTQYGYETVSASPVQRQLNTITDPNGNVIRTITYLGQRVQSITDGESNQVTFTYTGAPISTSTVVTYGKVGAPAAISTRTFTLDGEGNITGNSENASTGQRADTAEFASAAVGLSAPILSVPIKALNTKRTPASIGASYQTTYESATSSNPQSIVDPNSSKTDLSWNSPPTLPNLSVPSNVTLGSGSATPSLLGFTYDPNGALTHFKDARLNTTSIVRDAQGRVLTVTSPEFAAAPSTVSYAPGGEIASVTDANGKSETYAYLYSASGLIVTQTDKRGQPHTFTYDAVGALTKETHPLGRVVTHSYDTNRNRTKSVETFNGVETSRTVWTYDKNNRVTAVDQQSLSSTSLSKSLQTYDALGRVVSVTNPNTETTTSGFAGPDLTTVTQPLSRITSYVYDGAGRVASVTRAAGSPDAISESYLYDNIGRKFRTAYADSTYEEVTYVAGRSEPWVATARDRSGNITQYQYDPNGNILRVQDALNNVWTATYDKNNNTKTITDPRNSTTTYTYDALNRMTGITDANNRSWTYQYDELGNQTQSMTPSGGTGSIVITRSYDALNRPLAITYAGPQGSGTLASYTYNDSANPRTVTVSNATASSTFMLDALGRTTRFDEGGNRFLTYDYDPKGNVTSIGYPGSHNVGYGFDAAGRLSTVTPWVGGTTTYSYNSLDQITGTTMGNGTSVVYGFDVTKRLKRVTNLKGTTAISDVDFTIDARGKPLSANMVLPLNPTLAALNTTLTYDAANRLVGSSLGSYQHDDAGRTISQTVSGQTTSFGYNSLDLLTTLSAPGNSESFAYDALNARVGRTRNGTTTKHLWNPVGSLPNLSVDLDAADTPQRFYIYGNGLIGQIDASNVVHYNHFDLTGNTLALTDSSGAISDRYAYTPFGDTTSQGTTVNPFKFNGRFGVTDDGNGLVHMRARYYQPGVGRFLSLDSQFSGLNDPSRINRYGFAADDPFMRVDPSGFSFSGVTGSSTIGASREKARCNVWNPFDDNYEGCSPNDAARKLMLLDWAGRQADFGAKTATFTFSAIGCGVASAAALDTGGLLYAKAAWLCGKAAKSGTEFVMSARNVVNQSDKSTSIFQTMSPKWGKNLDEIYSIAGIVEGNINLSNAVQGYVNLSDFSLGAVDPSPLVAPAVHQVFLDVFTTAINLETKLYKSFRK